MKLDAAFLRFSVMLFALVLAALPPGASSAKAQIPNTAQIVFLHCKMKNDTITLVKSNLRPGVVKQKRGSERHGGIYYDVISASGKSLWNGMMDDPLVQRLEYGDPANPGQIKMKLVKLREAEFTLRLPFKAEAQRIEFFRLESSAEQNRRKILRRPIGGIMLQSNGGVAK